MCGGGSKILVFNCFFFHERKIPDLYWILKEKNTVTLKIKKQNMFSVQSPLCVTHDSVNHFVVKMCLRIYATELQEILFFLTLGLFGRSMFVRYDYLCVMNGDLWEDGRRENKNIEFTEFESMKWSFVLEK